MCAPPPSPACTLLCSVPRDELHQAGEGAAGGQGPAAGHARGGGHEAAGRRPARAVRAHCPPHHRPISSSCPPQESKKQSVSVQVTSRVTAVILCLHSPNTGEKNRH